MLLGHKLACLLVAAVMLIPAAHAGSMGSDETGVDATLGLHRADQGHGHAASCDDGRSCASVPGAALSHPHQAAATAQAARVPQSSAIPAMLSRMAPRAMLPAHIVFGNFRS